MGDFLRENYDQPRPVRWGTRLLLSVVAIAGLIALLAVALDWWWPLPEPLPTLPTPECTGDCPGEKP